ncbi:MAG: polysaccharide deacetylase family protein [Lysinibacillus sp.]
MKVKVSHTTAVYESNNKRSKKLFHTAAHRHVIVHATTKDGWSYIQDGERYGYIATTSLTYAPHFRAIINHPKHAIVRITPNFSEKASTTLQYPTIVNAYEYDAKWTIVHTNKTLGFAPKNRLKKLPPIKLGKYNSGITTKKKRVAITFDDGPNTKYTPNILKTLEKHNVKATFFVTGNNVTKYPTIAKQIVLDGHEIGNHTYSHPKLTSISLKSATSQITKTNNAIEKATGVQPTVFRPPYGSYNEKIVQAAKMPTILWSVDTLDWQHRNPTKLLQIVKRQVKNGSIILMHDTNNASLKGLEDVIKYLQQNNYEIVTVSEILTPVQ